MGEIVVKYKNQNYAFMQLKGNAEMRGMFPVKYDYEFKVNAVTMEKGDGEYKWVNNAQKFELMSKDTFVVSKQSPFHWMNIMVTRGREWTKMEHTRNFFFDKVNKAHMINKMKMEEHNILDGKTWYHIKYDNTAPRTAFLFTFLPYNMDRAWTYEGGREHTANGGFTMTHKITHGENVIQEGEMVFDVKANDGSKFEMEHLHKMTLTEESPFYGMVFWWTGRYGKTVERKMTVFFDKINKSFLFVPKMSMNTVMTIDGQKTSEFVFDNTQAKKHIKFFWAPDAFTKEYLFTDEWEYPTPTGCKWTTDLKRGGVSVWNWVGDYSWVNNANKFEFKTMDKVVQSQMSPFYGWDHFYVGKYYNNGERTKTFFFNGEEKATVDFDSSSKKASHTMHLPSGKDLTIDLAWPKMTTWASDLEFGVTITPDRKVVTKFGWEWAGVKKVYLDVVGNNPWIGDYKLSRMGEFEEISGSTYKMKWTGHGETTNGFLRRVSPVETNVMTSINTRNLHVDAVVWKSFAGKKYGFTLTNDKFLLLAGN